MNIIETIEQYKEKMCPYCINYKKPNIDECKIVMRIDGQAGCTNYKCKEYCKRRENNVKKL